VGVLVLLEGLTDAVHSQSFVLTYSFAAYTFSLATSNGTNHLSTIIRQNYELKQKLIKPHCLIARILGARNAPLRTFQPSNLQTFQPSNLPTFKPFSVSPSYPSAL
jgi:hypothetical protein